MYIYINNSDESSDNENDAKEMVNLGVDYVDT
jgi:hypothetical protein